MRVYVSSTPEELETYRATACDVARELGLEPVVRDPDGLRGFKPVAACDRLVASVDLVLVVVGHRRGDVPSPRSGGDGFHPWNWWETHAAFERDLPVTVLMAADGWRPELREDDAGARAVMRDFRGELGRLATLFDDEPGDGFRQLVRARLAALEEHLRRSLDGAFPAGRRAGATLGRTRALLALRELADAHGQRDEGRTIAVLARAIGRDGREVLESLATPQTRLVLREQQDDGQRAG